VYNVYSPCQCQILASTLSAFGRFRLVFIAVTSRLSRDAILLIQSYLVLRGFVVYSMFIDSLPRAA